MMSNQENIRLDSMSQELETIKACSIEQMWLKELGELKVAYEEFIEVTNKLGEKADTSKKSKKNNL